MFLVRLSFILVKDKSRLYQDIFSFLLLGNQHVGAEQQKGLPDE